MNPNKYSKFQHLIDPNTYQVFLLKCSVNLPFSFAAHTWFVCSKKGDLSRWEVLFYKNINNSFGYVHLNHFPPFSGIEKIPFIIKNRYWNASLISKIEGPIAQKMISFIEKSHKEYSYAHKYSLSGPNSNTYTQWVLNHFQEFKVNLPYNAIGKGYRKGNK